MENKKNLIGVKENPSEDLKALEEAESALSKKLGRWPRISIFIIFIGSGIALTLASLTSTGNAIGNLSGFSSGLLGVILFIIGITGMFFELRKN